MFLSGRNNTSPNAWFGSSQPQKHCLFCSVRANRSPGLASSLQTPSRVGSGFVSVRRLHGYWDSPEISSAFPGAQRRMFPCRCTCLFTCNIIIRWAVAGVKFLVNACNACTTIAKAESLWYTLIIKGALNVAAALCMWLEPLQGVLCCCTVHPIMTREKLFTRAIAEKPMPCWARTPLCRGMSRCGILLCGRPTLCTYR